MATNPIQMGAAGMDLSGRYFESHAVAGSPAAAVETIICTLTLPRGLFINKGVFLDVLAAFTVGTNGTNGNLRIRQTDASGTIIYATGGVTMAAASLQNLGAQGIDQSPSTTGQVYVATLTITAGTAVSTFSAVSLFAIVV
jgi:hypothetical protein